MRLLLSLLLFSVLCVSGYGRDSGQVAENSTSNGLEPKESSLSVVSSLSNLSDVLVIRLTERTKQTESSEVNFRKIIEEYETRWMRSELGWEQSRKDHEETLRLLSVSRTDYGNLKQSSSERAEADAKKIRQLESDMMKTAALWAAGGVVVGLIVGMVF